MAKDTDTEKKKTGARAEFFKTCTAPTVTIHEPIVDIYRVEGFLNPAGLGDADIFSRGNGWGQSTVAFDTNQEFKKADDSGRCYYGGAEYGVVGTPDSGRLAKKFAELHEGTGAVVLSSGLNAINNVFSTFLKGRKPTILIPDNAYYPAKRALEFMAERSPGLKVYVYGAKAGGNDIEKLLREVEKEKRKADLIYIEAPGSQTFEIAEIDEIVSVARAHKIKTVMDNTWASHVRFKPLMRGIDITVLATTKYEAGFGDTPSGIVVAKHKEDYRELAYTARVMGTGAVDKATCRRLFNRANSTATRMDMHYAAALDVTGWFQKQKFVKDILCPFLPASPSYNNFKKYFSGGNGLFTIVFHERIKPKDVENFLDNMLLFRQGESWGGHVSLAQPAHPKRQISKISKGEMVRFSIGLEDAGDLIRDLEHAVPGL